MPCQAGKRQSGLWKSDSPNVVTIVTLNIIEVLSGHTKYKVKPFLIFLMFLILLVYIHTNCGPNLGNRRQREMRTISKNTVRGDFSLTHVWALSFDHT